MYLAIPSQYLSIYLYLCEFKSASFHLSIFVYLVYVSIRSGVAATFSLGFTWVGSPSYGWNLSFQEQCFVMAHWQFQRGTKIENVVHLWIKYGKNVIVRYIYYLVGDFNPTEK